MDVREKLIEILAEYFNIGDSYAYNLTRVKSAFTCGTVGLDDFEEFDNETVEDIASYLIANGVTVQEWIPVKDRLPEEKGEYIVAFHPCYWDSVNENQTCVGIDTFRGKNAWAKKKFQRVTHWMEKPQPPKGE